MVNYSTYQAIEVKRERKVLVVTLNRPEKLNAINATLHAELAQIFADVARDSEAHAVVLTGAGRAFSAGGDVEWFLEVHSLPTDSRTDHRNAGGERREKVLPRERHSEGG